VATGRVLSRLDVIALFPLVALAALWLGFDDVVLLVAFGLPALLALRAVAQALPGAAPVETAYAALPARRGGLAGREAVLAALDHAARVPGHDTACILLQIDGWEGMGDRLGGETAEDLAQRCADRLVTALRHGDLVARLGDARFGVVLHPVPAARLGTREAICERLRTAIGEPVAVGGMSVRLTASAGHTNLKRDGGDVAEETLAAAELALAEAHRSSPGAVRAYAPGLLRQRRDEADLTGEVDEALAAGDIRAWFQPQIRVSSGAISGVEALARWHHPERGTLCPDTFLPVVDRAGRMDALGHQILQDALTALRAWDEAGLRIPSVSVNFSAAELRNPALADHVKWALDRLDLQPGRLTVEILETVAARAADDAVIATIAALRGHGVNLDLDDFGIGQASLSAIRRFGVSRIKIDQSFVIELDDDPEQQAMIAAILSMAQHLGVETLAEGVETPAVGAMLAQMGCDHMQGFCLARPMPRDAAEHWMTAQDTRIAHPARFDRAAG
jgi:diguanylate cyclase (GGDEF)-like protein